jgi:uncharacterized protein YndB with AHSA1/START domain
MKTLKFSVHIAAPREVVWNIMWGKESSKKWLSVLQEGTYAVSDWNEGSKIMFLSPDGDGMNSVIQRKIPNELMSFKHLNIMKHGSESSTIDKDKEWATENYYLHEEDGITQLKVEIETSEEFVRYFETTFPMALKKIKDLAEVPKGILIGGR